VPWAGTGGGSQSRFCGGRCPAKLAAPAGYAFPPPPLVVCPMAWPSRGSRAGEPPTLHAGGTARDSAMVLRACAALLAGEPAEAALLADADIRFGPDMALWRALYEMMTGGRQRAYCRSAGPGSTRGSASIRPPCVTGSPRAWRPYVARYGAPRNAGHSAHGPA
jgi:hypothetical protein